jgi:hypothetical protein
MVMLANPKTCRSYRITLLVVSGVSSRLENSKVSGDMPPRWASRRRTASAANGGVATVRRDLAVLG